MTCEVCNGDTEVFDSRFNDRQRSVWRRRKCLDCGAKTTTYEVSAEVYAMLRATENAITHLERAGASVMTAIDSIRESQKPEGRSIVSELRLEMLAAKAAAKAAS